MITSLFYVVRVWGWGWIGQKVRYKITVSWFESYCVVSMNQCGHYWAVTTKVKERRKYELTGYFYTILFWYSLRDTNIWHSADSVVNITANTHHHFCDVGKICLHRKPQSRRNEKALIPAPWQGHFPIVNDSQGIGEPEITQPMRGKRNLPLARL